VSPEDDLWKKYFTSSRYIKELREQYDDAEFVVAVDKTFESADDARAHEEKFLTENNCVRSDDWLNRANSGKDWNSTGEETRRKIGKASRDRVWTEETRRKMRERMLNCTDEYRKKMSVATKKRHERAGGDFLSEETRRKIGEAHKGKVVSEETRRKLSEAGKGKVLSEETRRKIGEAQKGKVVSEETRRKMRDAQKGRPPMSEESRQKQAKSLKAYHAKNKPVPISEETRQKMSRSKKAYYAKKRSEEGDTA
jgi:hypothetical protein